MKKISPSNKIYISKSKIPKAERGVFANCKIEKGEIIESCPIIEIPKTHLERLGDTVLVTYVYFFGKRKERILIALGFGSIYNHSYTPNALYKITTENKAIEFVSIREIRKGEEITVNYVPRNLMRLPLWFER